MYDMSKPITMLISSCDAYSDLWDGHVELLNRNWPGRDFRVLLVTDKPTDKAYAVSYTHLTLPTILRV